MAPTHNPDGSIYSSSTANNPVRYLGGSGLEKNRRRNLYSTLNAKYDLSPVLKGLGLFRYCQLRCIRDFRVNTDCSDGFMELRLR